MVEGLHSCNAVIELAEKFKIDMPITKAVKQVISGKKYQRLSINYCRDHFNLRNKMAYLIISKDKKNKLNLRLNAREKHLKYLESFKSKLLMAGPIVSKTGDPCGSVIALNFDDRNAIDKFIKNDPYNIVGLLMKL